MKLKTLIFLIVCVFLVGCSMQTQDATSAVDLVGVVSFVTDVPPLRPHDIPQKEVSLLLYEVISPESVQAENGVLIELNSASIEIHPVMGTLFRLGFRYTGITKDQLPESRAEFVDPPFITDLQLFRGGNETPIRLDVGGAGAART